ncbi:hypothetical protein F2P81_021484 [Scophthalmus maximus]|uniref:Uncharacterized protein n=1 Tax=Scophthalmus maximus TaxID=52904 RepID=A0A6A4S1A5_SCOMX|nr:hypothetical protein F2P81_021484 [Scophthalmus maximus]
MKNRCSCLACSKQEGISGFMSERGIAPPCSRPVSLVTADLQFPHHRSHSLNRRPSLIPPFRLNVDALVGAEETDVDTGDKVNPGNAVDFTVVSAYIKSNLPQTCRPSSAPPEDIGPSLSPGVSESAYRAATLGRTPYSFCTDSAHSTALGSCPQSTGVTGSAAPSLSDMSMNQSDSCSIISVPVEEEEEEEEEEEDQEFYI